MPRFVARTENRRRQRFRKVIYSPSIVAMAKEDSMDTGHVSALHAKHAGLEARIRDEIARPAPDDILVATLKKQKLQIKQELAQSSA
jgi:hypothetical protein